MGKMNNLDVALFRAIHENNLSDVQGALDAGANVNATDEKSETPLHRAALRAKEDVVLRLLDHGAGPNFFNEAGETPLHIAAALEKFGVAAMLLKAGADLNAQMNMHTPTPLYTAFVSDMLTRNDLRSVRFLLERGADPHTRVCRMNKRWTILEILEDKVLKTERDERFIALIKDFIDHPVNPRKPDPAAVQPPSSADTESLKKVQQLGRQIKGKFRLK